MYQKDFTKNIKQTEYMDRFCDIAPLNISIFQCADN